MKQPKGQAYIKISEEEIADDYPLPAQYELQEEELDEFVVAGNEDALLDVDPECLPKMARPCTADAHVWPPATPFNVNALAVWRIPLQGMPCGGRQRPAGGARAL